MFFPTRPWLAAFVVVVALARAFLSPVQSPVRRRTHRLSAEGSQAGNASSFLAALKADVDDITHDEITNLVATTLDEPAAAFVGKEEEGGVASLDSVFFSKEEEVGSPSEETVVVEDLDFEGAGEPRLYMEAASNPPSSPVRALEPSPDDTLKADAFFDKLQAVQDAEEEWLQEQTEDLQEDRDLVAALGTSPEEYREVGMLEDERLGEKNSHELVTVDEDGDPVTDRDRMVFVDEATCIGCTNCACVAPQTFTMNEEHGRARAVRQDGDTEEIIAEAIATCPVDCIHWVPWDELVTLEGQRAEVMTSYNFKGRLVGNDGFLSTNGAGTALLDISSNNAMRCNNCPTNKCPECPMFSVADDSALENLQTSGKNRKRCGNCPTNGCIGCPVAKDNPEFQKRRSRRIYKRKQRLKNEQDEIRRQAGLTGPLTQVEL